MKKAFILSVLFYIPLFYSYSQMVEPSSFSTDWEVVAARKSNMKLNYASIEGSPYYTSNMTNCEVTLIDGSSLNVPLRYDLYLDEIEFKKDDLTLWVNKKDIKTIQYDDDLIGVEPLPEDTSKLSYFFIQNTGKYSIFVKKSVAYHPYVAPRPYADPVPERFLNNKDEYYLKVEDMPLRKISSRKDLTSIFSNNKSAQDFIKNEKIKVNDLADLNKLVGFLNKL